MKKSFLAGLMSLSFLFSACASVVVNKDTQPKTKSNPLKSVGILQIKVKDRVVGAGTAFAYDRDHLLTAGHVCMVALKVQVFVTRQEALNIKVFDEDGEESIIDGVKVESLSETDDLCMLTRPDHGLKPVKLLDSYKNVKVRDYVSVVGAPAGLAVGEFEGRVMVPKFKSDNAMLKDRLIVSSATTGGVSGSPVFDKNNRLIGMLVAGHPTFDHLSICVNGDAILEFLRKNGYL